MLDYTHNAIVELETALEIGTHSTATAKSVAKTVRKRKSVD
jgi:hypothetical protein